MACNESFLSDPDLVEYALCIPDTADKGQDCPITSLSFTLDGMDESTAAKYQQRTANGSSTAHFYFSKSVAGMPIDSVEIGPT